MRKLTACLIAAFAFFGIVNFLPAQEILTFEESSIPYGDSEIRWYRSNSAGLAIESMPSRLVALRNEYCLSVERINLWELPMILPEILRPFFDYSYNVELRIIHENGKEFRRQWIFRDSGGSARITASGSGGFFGGAEPGEETGDTPLDE